MSSNFISFFITLSTFDFGFGRLNFCNFITSQNIVYPILYKGKRLTMARGIVAFCVFVVPVIRFL